MVRTANLFDAGIFPSPETAEPDGMLAAGGNLAETTLLEAYSKGIFPWYSEGSPILWWSPDPRMVLFPGSFRVSKSLAQSVRNRGYRVHFDRDFASVVEACAGVPRKGNPGTWITTEMKEAYCRLHVSGYAHSAEAWLGEEMVGGLYGLSLGGIFFGESMFHTERDASKVALYRLVERLKEWEFDLIDVQQSTPHMQRLGAVEIPRRKFTEILERSLNKPTRMGSWTTRTQK